MGDANNMLGTLRGHADRQVRGRDFLIAERQRGKHRSSREIPSYQFRHNGLGIGTAWREEKRSRLSIPRRNVRFGVNSDALSARLARPLCPRSRRIAVSPRKG
jgi:hypothetical protein